MKVCMYIAVSEVVDTTDEHQMRFAELKKIVERNPRIFVNSILFKANIGRDFSSHALNLRQIAKSAGDDDYVFFLNRSATGPYDDGWYVKYLNQLNIKAADIAGSTINFLGHPDGINTRSSNTHIQTYAFVAKFGSIRSLIGNFPGESETQRINLIDNGEIGLSQVIMENGGTLTCLAWPNHSFNKDYTSEPTLPHRDIKEEVTNLPFLHRKRASFHKLSSIKLSLDRLRFQRWIKR